MKNFLIFLICFNGAAIYAQNYEKITASMAAGNAIEVGAMFDSKVDLSILGKDQTISKDEALQSIKKFFTQHEASAFSIVHKGVSQNDVRYMIGELKTASGAFRVTIYLRLSEDKYLIQSLEIEAD